MSADCPTCEESFDSEHGKNVHHAHAHGESITHVTAECRNCQQTFRYQQSQKSGEERKFCSVECRNDFSRVTRECGYCGCLFTLAQSKVEQGEGKYCSKECQLASERVQKTCNACGDEFTLPQSRARRERGVYCSKDCEHSVGRVEVTCKHCGESVDKPQHRVDRHDSDFCSFECYLSYREAGGERAPGWIDGRYSEPDYYADYNQKFHEKRKETLKRDNYECQACGMTNEEHKQELGMELHVHHIRPVSDFDIADEAHELDNLVTFCLSCHGKWEGIPLKPEGSV